MKAAVSWADGSPFAARLDASAAKRAVDRIKKENGGAAPTDAVVNAARDPDHPLHGAFTWDDGEAAHQFRLVEARRLMRDLVIIRESGEPRRIFVNVVRGDDARGYVDRETSRVVLDYRRQQVQKGFRILDSFVREFGDLGEFSTVVKAARDSWAAAKVEDMTALYLIEGD